MNVFDFLNSINQNKTPFMDEDPLCEKIYNPFIINKSLSYFSDTIFLANEMNKCNNIDKKLQFDFLRISTRPRKRFSKWYKPQEDDRINALKALYGYSDAKARQVVDLIKEDDWTVIFEQISTGGVNTKFHK